MTTELIAKYTDKIKAFQTAITALDIAITNEEDSATRLAELRASKVQAIALIDAYTEFVNDLSN